MHRLLSSLIGLLFALSAIEASAQQCASAEGNWTDNYSQTFSLTQGSGSISGPVTGLGCGNIWFTWGTFIGGGAFSLTAENPWWTGYDGCAAWFIYDGTINKPGCYSGNPTVQYNALSLNIGVATVTSSRSGQSATRTWP